MVEFTQKVYEQFVPLFENSSLASTFKADDIGDVWFDQEKMATILYNLIANAINNTEAGGQVKIEVFVAKRKELKLLYPNSFEVEDEITNDAYAYIKVVDTGVGISQKSISQIFDRFYHLGTSKDKHLGTGIGLALLKNLVLLHQGHVIVSSERSSGTEFYVGLPIGEAHLKANEKAFETADVEQINLENFDLGKTENIGESTSQLEEANTLPLLLLVEDNIELREVLKEHFSHEYQVIEAGNGKEALAFIQYQQFDFVVSDIMMPEMDGLELVKEIRDDIQTSHIPVALLTAKSSTEDQIAGTEAGADLYFPKPFNLKLMDLKMRQFVDSRRKLHNSYASNVFAENRELVRNKKDKEFLDHFIQLVDSNIDNNDFTVDQICTELCIGRTNLYKKIRSITGQSMGEFIRGIRLKKAAKILLTEDVTISEVLYRVGINSNSYFTKSFKAQFGMTPSEFIQQNGGKL